MSFIWLPPARPLPAETVQRLRDRLHAHTDAYCDRAAELLNIWPAMAAPGASAKELHDAIRQLCDAIDALTPMLEQDTLPYPVREAMLTRERIRDPHGFIEDLQDQLYKVRDAANVARNILPKPKRGKRAETPARDWIEAQLLAVFADVTGKPETSMDAAECAAIVLEVPGLRGCDAKSMQRRDERRRKRMRGTVGADEGNAT